MPVNVGLIGPVGPQPYNLQVEELGLKIGQLGVERDKLAFQEQQVKQQQKQREIKNKIDWIDTNLETRQLPARKKLEFINQKAEIFGIDPIKVDDAEAVKLEDEIVTLNSRYDKIEKNSSKLGIKGETIVDNYSSDFNEILSRYGGIQSSSKAVDMTKEKIASLEAEKNIAPQAESLAAQLISNGVQADVGQLTNDIAGMLANGVSVNDILTTYGQEKPGAGAGVKQKITQTAEEISLELYNKSFTELSPDERADVLQTKQDRAVEVSTGKVKGRIEAGLDAPLSSTDLTKFVNPDTLAKFPAGTTMREVRKSGGFAATPTQLQKIADLDNAGFIVTQLDELSKQIITATDAASALIQGGTLKAGAFAKTNTAAAAYEDQLAQFTGVISRALGGERGVLTDTDIRRVVNGMPKFRDTKAIRDFKMGVIQLLFETATDAQKRAITGRAKDPKIRKELNVLLDAIGLGGKRIDTGGKQEIQKQVDTSSMDINTMTREELAAEKQRLMSKPAQ